MTQDEHSNHIIEQRHELQKQIRDMDDMPPELTTICNIKRKKKLMQYQAVLKEIPGMYCFAPNVFIVPDFFFLIYQINSTYRAKRL